MPAAQRRAVQRAKTTSSGVISAPRKHLEARPRPVLNLYRRRPDTLAACGVIPEIDIWRAALLLLKRYSERALDESAARADELALAGDDDGAATWRRIIAAVTQLANKMPPGPVH